jgi:VWFA-related protein
MKVRLFITGLFLTGVIASAQEPKLSETIVVPITNVDLVITDAKGNHVSGLAKSELELIENGVAREITNFSELRKNGADESKGISAPVNRRILLVFDLNSLPFASKRQMVAAARKFVADNLRPNDRLAVVTAGNTLAKLTDWTNDAAAINRGLDAAGLATGSAVEQREATEKRLRQKIGESMEPGGRFSWSFSDLTTESRAFAQTSMNDVVQSISVMNAALQVFGPTTAKKVVVMAGGGLPIRPGGDIFEYLEILRQRASSGEFGKAMMDSSKNAAPLSDATQFDVTPQLRVLAQKAVRTGAAIYALDPDMSRSSSGAVERQIASDNSSDFAAVASRASGYQYLAGITGGIAVLGMKAPEALEKVANDLDSYYSIGYRSAVTGDEPPKLEVRSKSGYRVRYNFGGMQGSRDSVVEARVVANQMEAPSSNDLGITIVADASSLDGGAKRVKVKVLIPVKNLKLIRDGDDMTGGINVFVSMGSADGSSSEVQKRTHELRLAASDMPEYLKQELTYAVVLTLEPGRTQVSIGVMDQRSEKTGFGRISI